MVDLNVIALVQARMSSSRLPGKVLMPLGEATVIEGVLTRLQRSQNVDKVMLVTSHEQSDDLLAETVREAGFPVFREV
ncbi:cytidylyltransferase domain-containing protein [Aliamphritea spongicola]|nr:hypothetical protein [Aliamphritea spongicola]